ncbi:MAG: diaminopimelate decarboxylase [Candidatus Micrarchaeia archaeon]
MPQWWEERGHLEVRDNRLFIGGIAARELAERFGTPLYVVNADKVIENYRRIRDAYRKFYPRVSVHYAMKANASLALLELLRREGAGVDCVSGGEMLLARRAGFDGSKMIFTINTKTREEIKFAVENGVTITLDAESEVEQVEEIASEEGKKALVCFRVNPDVAAATHTGWQTGRKESKFGIPLARAVEAYEKALAANFVEPIGVHTHIGSQILNVRPFAQATAKLMRLCGQLKDVGARLRFVDLGGGIGIRYRKEERALEPERVAKAVLGIVKEEARRLGLGNIEVKIEPGRYIVGNAGILLTRVHTIKQGATKKFVAVDAGFNVLARPMVYGSWHEAVVADNVTGEQEEKVDVVGNICESGDVLATERRLPVTKEGDIIAFLCAGAYGMSMASNYNMRPLPAEVLVRRGKAFLVRERQAFEELLLNQRVPEGL